MTTTPASEPGSYEPVPDQVARAAALRRFNWLYVYVPLGLAFVVATVLIGLLIWGSLSPNIVGTREFASAFADLIIIFAAIPLMLTCSVVPVTAAVYLVYARRQPKRPYDRVQVLFWRVDALLTQSQSQLEGALSKVTRPLITGHARGAFLGTLFRGIKNMISRS